MALGITVGTIVGKILLGLAGGASTALGGYLAAEALTKGQNNAWGADLNKTMELLPPNVQDTINNASNAKGEMIPKASENTEERTRETDAGLSNWITSAEGQDWLTKAQAGEFKPIEDVTNKKKERETTKEILRKDNGIVKPGPFIKEIPREINQEQPKEEEEENKTPPLPLLPGSNSEENKPIEDETNTNVTQDINWISQIEKWRNEQWEREDTIRAETQAREDNAYQRSVSDMIKAGINPNLMNVQPASAGGGITNATGVDSSPLTNQMQIDLDEMQQLIDNAFKEDENSKDRFMEIFSNILQMIAMKIILKK